MQAATAPLSSSSAAQPALASGYHTASTSAARQTASSVFTVQELTMWGMTLKVMREEGGLRALYRGLIPTAMGVAPYVGGFMLTLIVRSFPRSELIHLQASTSHHTRHCEVSSRLPGRAACTGSSYAALWQGQYRRRSRTRSMCCGGRCR